MVKKMAKKAETEKHLPDWPWFSNFLRSAPELKFKNGSTFFTVKRTRGPNSHLKIVDLYA